VVSYAKELMHGKQSLIQIDQDAVLFTGLSKEIKVARYHSLAVIEESLPLSLQVIARSGDGEIMALKHRTFPIYGVQFHPESILTLDGKQMIENFLRLTGGTND